MIEFKMHTLRLIQKLSLKETLALMINISTDDLNHTTLYSGQGQAIPLSTRHWINDGLMLAQRPRRWPNINPASGQCLVLAATCNAQPSDNIAALSNISCT